MRELLADSGSLFMQIGDENVHRAAILLDEVFGAENRVATIPYATSGGVFCQDAAERCRLSPLVRQGKATRQVPPKSMNRCRVQSESNTMSSYAMLELADGSTRRLTENERVAPDKHLPAGSRAYKRVALTSPGTSTTGRSEPYVWDGHTWPCPAGEHWRVSMAGMDHLAELGRLDSAGPGSALMWKWYEEEVPGRRINNMWHRQRFASDKRYVVQTADSVIERCVLMATDPGDLVFDPTCGGATTAVAAEKWGRRWITCGHLTNRCLDRPPADRHFDVPLLDAVFLSRRRCRRSKTVRQPAQRSARRQLEQ